MIKKIITSPFFYFPLVTCIVFWPLSLQLFTLKNDALTYYYPIRILISDALNNHELPLWTPYINMGYPLHADMQSGAWNPVIWLFAFATQYSLAAFHWELILYLSFGGIGMYYLCKEFACNKLTAAAIGTAYQFSGFMTDSVQFFACISAACYLPYVFLFFKRLVSKQQFNDAFAAAFFLFLLFTGGYPSLFIIIIYLLAAYSIFIFFSGTDKKNWLKKVLLPMIAFFIVFILLSLPSIISYLQHLQFIDRGKKQALDFVLENSMPPAAMISLISPFSTTANASWLNTDPLMRNTYMGIIPLLFITYSLFSVFERKNTTVQFFFITGLIMFMLAWGSHFFLRETAYYVLPLMNTFRHPALFRLFGIFCLLLVSAISMTEWQLQNDSKKNLLLKKITGAFIIGIILSGLLVIFFSEIKIVSPGTENQPVMTQLKNLVYKLSFSQRFLLQLPLTLLILFIFYYLLQKSKPFYLIVLLVIADLFLAVQYNVGVTVIGAKRFKEVETIINRNKEKFPLPNNNSIEKNSFHTIDQSGLTGSTIPFRKIIGRNDYFITPGNLSTQEKFYQSSMKEQVFSNPLVYFADTILTTGDTHNLKSNAFAIPFTALAVTPASLKSTGKDFIKIIYFSANQVQCEVYSQFPACVIYLQNYYPGWKAFINEKEVVLNKTNITFMSATVPAGKHILSFKFLPYTIIYSWYFSLLPLIITIMILLRYLFRNRFFLKKQDQ